MRIAWWKSKRLREDGTPPAMEMEAQISYTQGVRLSRALGVLHRLEACRLTVEHNEREEVERASWLALAVEGRLCL